MTEKIELHKIPLLFNLKLMFVAVVLPSAFLTKVGVGRSMVTDETRTV